MILCEIFIHVLCVWYLWYSLWFIAWSSCNNTDSRSWLFALETFYANFFSSSAPGKYQYVPLMFLDSFMMSSQLLSSLAPTIRSSMYSKFWGEAAYPMKKRPASELRDPKGIDWRTISTGLACCQPLPTKPGLKYNTGTRHLLCKVSNQTFFFNLETFPFITFNQYIIHACIYRHNNIKLKAHEQHNPKYQPIIFFYIFVK